MLLCLTPNHAYAIKKNGFLKKAFLLSSKGMALKKNCINEFDWGIKTCHFLEALMKYTMSAFILSTNFMHINFSTDFILEIHR